MTKWNHFDIKGITAPVNQIKTVVNGIDKVISVIDIFNQTVNNIISILNSLKLPVIKDPKVYLINSLIDMLQNMIRDFANTGGYMLPIFPQDNKGNDAKNPTGLEGGSVTFRKKIIDSFSDPYDDNRPQYDDRAMVGGIVLAVDSGNIASFISSFSSLASIFNFSDVPSPIADVVGLNARSFKNKVLLQWTKGFGIEPTEFVIEYRALDETEYKTEYLNVATWNAGEKNKNLEQLIIDGITDVVSFIPHGVYRFIHSPQKNTIYSYRVYSRYNATESKPATIQAAPQLYTVGTLLSQNICAYVGCRASDETLAAGKEVTAVTELTFFCEADATTRMNFNQKTCLAGTTVCEKVLNANCKFNNGKKCTSTGLTYNKYQKINKNGEVVPLDNTDFWNATRCQKGTTSRFCDGYEKEIQKNSSPPDWSKYTMRTILPDFVNLLDSTVGFLEGFKGKTAKEDDVQLIFSNTLLGTTEALRNKLTEIRRLINKINSVFNVSLPNAYILSIPPQRGGVKYFINEFSNALEGPNSDSKGYTTGLVFLVGGLDVNDVNSKWQAFQAIF